MPPLQEKERNSKAIEVLQKVLNQEELMFVISKPKDWTGRRDLMVKTINVLTEADFTQYAICKVFGKPDSFRRSIEHCQYIFFRNKFRDNVNKG